MFIANKDRIQIGYVCRFLIILMLLATAGCKTQTNTVTIGIAAVAPTEIPVFVGLKEGMAEFGYIEGETVRYLYKHVLPGDTENIDAGIEALLDQHIDILITLEGEVSLRANQLLKGTDVPHIFGAVPRPVEIGLVRSLKQTGGNITGVKPPYTISKALEWLSKITPDIKKVYVPYSSNDATSNRDLPVLLDAAEVLGIELVLSNSRSTEDVVQTIENLPEDIDAVFMISSLTFNPMSSKLTQAAIQRGIPTGAPLLLNDDVLITFTGDFFGAGRKTARLIHQVIQGIKPEDLPVETAEPVLIVNLKTAEKIGVQVPDDILVQATTILQ